MHKDLQDIESTVLGMTGLAVNKGGAGLTADQRFDRLAGAVHALLRVVSNALEELDDLRASD